MTGRFFLRIFLLIALATQQRSARGRLACIVGRSLQSPLPISARLLPSPFFPSLTGAVILIRQPLRPVTSLLSASWTTIACCRMCRPKPLFAIFQQTAPSAGRGILNLTAMRIRWKRAHGRSCSHRSSLGAKLHLRFEATLHAPISHTNSVRSEKRDRHKRDPRFAVLADNDR